METDVVRIRPLIVTTSASFTLTTWNEIVTIGTYYLCRATGYQITVITTTYTVTVV